MLQGSLFVYHPSKKLCAFKAGSFPTCLVLLGGLTDGLLTIGYEEQLCECLLASEVSFVQPLLSSSYTGYGLASIEQDAEEIAVLLSFLAASHREFFLLGHSTGCQDLVAFAKSSQKALFSGPLAKALRGFILQAPSSDRLLLESKLSKSETSARLTLAAACKETLLPLHFENGIPITGSRFTALYAVGGAEDFFSADLGAQTWQTNLACLAGIPVLVVLSGLDESVPASVNQGQLIENFRSSIGCLQFTNLPNSNHGITACAEDLQLFLQACIKFIKQHKN